MNNMFNAVFKKIKSGKNKFMIEYHKLNKRRIGVTNFFFPFASGSNMILHKTKGELT